MEGSRFSIVREPDFRPTFGRGDTFEMTDLLFFAFAGRSGPQPARRGLIACRPGRPPEGGAYVPRQADDSAARVAADRAGTGATLGSWHTRWNPTTCQFDGCENAAAHELECLSPPASSPAMCCYVTSTRRSVLEVGVLGAERLVGAVRPDRPSVARASLNPSTPGGPDGRVLPARDRLHVTRKRWRGVLGRRRCITSSRRASPGFESWDRLLPVDRRRPEHELGGGPDRIADPKGEGPAHLGGRARTRSRSGYRIATVGVDGQLAASSRALSRSCARGRRPRSRTGGLGSPAPQWPHTSTAAAGLEATRLELGPVPLEGNES